MSTSTFQTPMSLFVLAIRSRPKIWRDARTVLVVSPADHTREAAVGAHSPRVVNDVQKEFGSDIHSNEFLLTMSSRIKDDVESMVAEARGVGYR